MKIIPNSDVLLLNVPMDRILHNREEIASYSAMPPLGLLYIASNLKKEGYKTSFIDITVEIFEMAKLIPLLKEVRPKIIGISTYVESWDTQKLICSFLKRIFPEAKFVAGGHCANFCYKELLKDTEFDFILRGEGEFTFVALCDFLLNGRKSLKDVKGLVYSEAGRIKMNPDADRITEIDELEYPDRDALNFSLYGYPFTISTARGCPGRCIFCSSQAFWGNRVCLRKPEKIIDEIYHVYRSYQLKEFFIVDDTFTLVPSRTIKFCEMLIEMRDKLKENLIWGCESRADVVSEEMLEIMSSSGCKMIQFGMESGNNQVLKSIKKAVTYEQIYESVEMTHRFGINTNVSYIIGHPEDTWDTVNETLEKALELKNRFHANVICSVNTPYPGTELYTEREALGVEILIPDLNQYRLDRPIINTKHLTANDIRRLYVKASEMLS